MRVAVSHYCPHLAGGVAGFVDLNGDGFLDIVFVNLIQN